MTLRVNISIVPYGVEENEYSIARIDIHNDRLIEDQGFGNQLCEYRAEFKQFAENNWFVADRARIIHNRRDGAILLAEKACEAFKDSL